MKTSKLELIVRLEQQENNLVWPCEKILDYLVNYDTLLPNSYLGGVFIKLISCF